MAVPYLPPEIMSRIFGWIHPHTVYKLRRISKGLNSLISSGAFGRENLAHFFSAPTTSDAITSTVANEFDCLFFKLPAAFRMVYAEKYLSKLTHIDWNNEAEMAAELPREIRLLSNLKTLVITSSQLRGSIPKELGLMSKLNYVGLWENALTGNLPNLTGLYLDHNQLSGALPAEFGNLGELLYASLNNNRLTGAIPSAVTNLRNLERFDLRDNAGLTCDFSFEVMQL
ncbi:hypothetical protein HDU77_008774 [Chytriomyces hyalinus]|nr:hypothetical protein HDU77_008774 [Chytriomyces hyalinus]